jgi:D-alanyl-D-alanine dipeptidase
MIQKLGAIAFFLSLGSLVALSNETPQSLVDAKKYDFSLLLDIRYATTNNFTKAVVYPEARCLLKKSVAEALSRVQSALKVQRLQLKVFDCYRPLSVQRKFWQLVPDERYVANPEKGSRHNRGAAVDVSLVDLEGKEIEMPTGYDDFTEKAHRNYSKLPKKAIRNRDILEKAMAKEGFVGLDTEWWHFDFKGWESFPIEDVSFSEVP